MRNRNQRRTTNIWGVDILDSKDSNDPKSILYKNSVEDNVVDRYEEDTRNEQSKNEMSGGVFYTSDGTYIGQIGNSSEVRLINDRDKEEGVKYVKWAMFDQTKGTQREKEYKWNTNKAIEYSTDTKLTQEELNTRAFLRTIKEMENHGNGELSYDTWNRDVKFTSYADHPGTRTFTENNKTIKSSSAGAYQIMKDTWNADQGWEPKIKSRFKIESFSPRAQDIFVLGLVDLKRKLLSDVKAGNIEQVFNSAEMQNEWTSTPGASQAGVSLAKGLNIFKAKIADELQGNTSLSIKQGDLFNLYK
jgi:muramidase (phage lysozyme)